MFRRRPDRLDRALQAADRGLAVFAIPAGERVPQAGWQQRCTTVAEQIELLVDAGNIGVGCRASDVVGLDLDKHGDGCDGVAGFARLCADHGVGWPVTFTVRTPSGGLHLYFRAGGRPIPSGSGRRAGLGLGIDVRGPGLRTGGYLLAPGSEVDKQPYLIETDVPVVELPPWLVDVLV